MERAGSNGTTLLPLAGHKPRLTCAKWAFDQPWLASILAQIRVQTLALSDAKLAATAIPSPGKKISLILTIFPGFGSRPLLGAGH